MVPSRSRSRGALALAALLLAAALAPASPLHAQQQAPTVIWGRAASPDTEVVVLVDGVECETASVGADGDGYVWTVTILPGECGAATGSEIRFTIDGRPAAETLTWGSGLATAIALTVTEPAGEAAPAAPEPPATTAPAPEGEAEEPGTITTTLHPGWNMAAWLGPEAPVTDIFDAVPALVRVGGWDAAEQRYRWRMPNIVPRNGLRVLTTGMGLWLELGGDAPVEWTRPAREESVLLSLDLGRNLVGWAGRDGFATAKAFARFGDLLTGAWRWDAEAQAYERYGRGAATGANTLDALDHGDALWLELTGAARWWQSGRGPSPVMFVGEVPEAQQAQIRDWVHDTRAVYAERWAVEAPFASYVGDVEALTPKYVEIRGGSPGNLCANYGSSVVFARIGCISAGTYPHEYFHTLQEALRGYRRVDVPGWMIEGSASWAGELFLGVTSDEETVPEHLDRHLASDLAVLTTRDLPALEEVEEPSAFYPYGGPGYSLGFVAVDWLVDRSAEEGVIDFFRNLAVERTWHEAFEAAFGIATGDFYDAFEAYRAEVAPPLPHLVDDSLDPVLVTVGEMSPATAESVRSRFAALRGFFAERFGGGTMHRTVYVGGRDALAPVYTRVFAEEIPADFCTRESGGAVIVTLECYESRPSALWRPYFEDVRDRLAPWDSLPELPDGRHRRGPLWLRLAVESYSEHAYEVASGAAELASIREAQIWLARRTALELADIESWEDTDGRRAKPRSLTFLAGEWLAEHAGERALLDYYRQLPAAASWQEAFEAAFGVTVDDFHEAFAAYRADIAPPFVLHHVRGVVLDPEGRPSAATWVAANRNESRWEDTTETAEDGSFDLVIRDGRYYLNVDLWSTDCAVTTDYRLQFWGVLVVEGADVTEVEIRLPEGSSCAPS